MTTTKKRRRPGGPPGRRPDPDRLLSVVLAGATRKEAVAMLGITGAALDSAVRNGCPRLPDGSFEVAAVVAWLRKRDSERAAKGIGGSDPELRRWRSARADREELRLEEDRHRLVPMEEVEARTVRQVLTVKAALQAMVRRLPSRLLHAPSADWIEEELLREVAAICNAFAAGLDDAAGTDSQAASAALANTTDPTTSSTSPAPQAATTERTNDVATGTARPADAVELTDTPADEAGTTTNEE